MEAGNIIFSPPPLPIPGTHLRNASSCSAVAGTSVPATSVVQHFPASVPLQKHDPPSNEDTTLQISISNHREQIIPSSVKTQDHTDEGLKIEPGFIEDKDPFTAGHLNTLALARTAMLASKEAAFLADNFDILEKMLVPAYPSSCLWEVGSQSLKDSVEGRVIIKSS